MSNTHAPSPEQLPRPEHYYMSLYGSSVLGQLEAWVVQRERAPATIKETCSILGKRSKDGLHRRLHLLINPPEPSAARLQRLRQHALTHHDLPEYVENAPTYVEVPKRSHHAKNPSTSTYVRPKFQPESSAPARPRPVVSHKRKHGASPASTAREPVVLGMSSSGRVRKMPGKLMEPHSPVIKPYQRKPNSDGRPSSTASRRAPTPGSSSRGRGGPAAVSRQNSRSIFAGGKASSKKARERAAAAEEDTSVRVGEDHQAAVPKAPNPRDCYDRHDVLLWSPTACPLGEAEMRSYLDASTVHLGGGQGTPDQPAVASASPWFPEEMACQVLHASRYDAEAALASLAAAPPPLEEWSKAEERQFHAAIKKHTDLNEVAELVKTKDLRAVVRFYYLEMGRRQKESRDKKREIENLKKERSRTHGSHAKAEPAPNEAASSSVDGVKPEPSDE